MTEGLGIGRYFYTRLTTTRKVDSGTTIPNSTFYWECWSSSVCHAPPMLLWDSPLLSTMEDNKYSHSGEKNRKYLCKARLREIYVYFFHSLIANNYVKLRAVSRNKEPWHWVLIFWVSLTYLLVLWLQVQGGNTTPSPPGQKQVCLEFCQCYTSHRENGFQDYFILWNITIFRSFFLLCSKPF